MLAYIYIPYMDPMGHMIKTTSKIPREFPDVGAPAIFWLGAVASERKRAGDVVVGYHKDETPGCTLRRFL